MEIDPTVHLTAPFPDIRPVSVIVMLPVRPLGTAIGRNFSLSLTHTCAFCDLFVLRFQSSTSGRYVTAQNCALHI